MQHAGEAAWASLGLQGGDTVGDAATGEGRGPKSVWGGRACGLFTPSISPQLLNGTKWDPVWGIQEETREGSPQEAVPSTC